MRSTTSTHRTTGTRRVRRVVGGLAATALVALPLSACGTEEDAGDAAAAATTSESSESSEAGAPEPVAAIESLTGEDTQITLDQGFLDALTQLKLQPGTIGEATLEGAAAKGEKGAKDEKARLSPEALAMQQMMRGVHF